MGSPLSALSSVLRGLSLWHETARPTGPRGRRSTVTSTRTSRSSARATPGSGPRTTCRWPTRRLRIVVVEAEVAGFGASGRNGGWCSALFPTSLARGGSAPATAPGPAPAMRASVDEVGAVTLAEGIDCHFAKGGTIVARAEPRRSSRGLARRSATAVGTRGRLLLSAAEAGERLRGDADARRDVHPRLRGDPPRAAGPRPGRGRDRRGVALHERTPALSIEPGVVRTPRGSVRAPYVVRATEGYTPRLPGLARAVVPVYSLIIATEPLSPRSGTRSAWRGGRRSRTTGT